MAVFGDARATFLAIVKGDTSQAVTEFNKFGTSVSKSTAGATTSVGKFRSMSSSAFAEVKANAGLLAAGAGAALGAFALHAVNAFSDLAKSAIDLGNATGFSTEEASRWIAVADDYEVSADTLATSVGRISKTLNDSKWAEYGIETRTASGEARSANDVFLDTLDLLSRTTNETERGRIAADLLGRGWQGIAPILGKTRDEYEQMLGAVEDGQVITDKEAEKGEKWRLAMDELSDAFGEFTLVVGESVAELAPLITSMAKLVSLANDLKVFSTPFSQFSNAAGDVKLMSDETFALADAAKKSGDAVSYLREQGIGIKEAEQMMRLYEMALIDIENAKPDPPFGSAFVEQIIATTEAAETHRKKMGEVDAQYDDLDGSVNEAYLAIVKLNDYLAGLSDENSLLDLEEGFRALEDTALEAWIATAEGSEDARDKQIDYQQGLNDLQIEAAEYLDQVLGLPEEQITEILAEIDRGTITSIEGLLNYLARNRTSYLKVTPIFNSAVAPQLGGNYWDTNSGYSTGASGGPFMPGDTKLVGEHGPEILRMGSATSGYLTPNRKLGGGGVTVVNNGIMTGSPAEIGAAIMDCLEAAGKDGRRMSTPVAA